ncbi:MAG: four helix bundle protein [Verrucomicrobia bacterium]|nr:four helix bundle protein [Verrucomicrobiota bacterium]
MKNDLRLRTKVFALEVIRLYGSLPKDTVSQVLGRQMLRAGTSVGANYREGNRARSKAEFIAKMGDCLKEADETLYWLELLDEEKLLRDERGPKLLNEADQLVSIFTAILKSSKGE